MRALHRTVIGFLDSLSGRLGLLLACGLVVASFMSLLLAEHARRDDFEHIRLERVVDSVADMIARFTRDPRRTQALLRENRILGARDAPPGWTSFLPDSRLTTLLSKRLGSESDARATPMSREACFPNFDLADRAAGVTDITLPECWYVVFLDGNGIERRVAVDLMPFRVPPSSIFDPLSLLLIGSVAVLLSIVGARFATIPLRMLTEAARVFSVTIDPEPIREDGPREVRAALRTFNLMQNRVREGFRERTQILASVTHDLQTPLTRLRLRLEQVEDDHLRERLISDLAVTQKLVKDGLEFARSIESSEPWSVVDIDSILSSVAEDAAEFGASVRFVSGCGAELRTKPNALSRCLTNLVDNAIKYAGDAELSCERTKSGVAIVVKDRGPGIPEDEIERVLQPFQRHHAIPDRPGSGLGLSIADAQARTFGGQLVLKNIEPNGLTATIVINAV
ncbi:ATP-binding protein [Rhizobium leguminosarum]|uniref:ATP-binding protein n=1 Tax=Rhizobium leguminosarum TaxID=384 RepID=UPI001C8FD8C0|nr:ATP-binding protein [Rhizobium leguminosarum]MBY3002054.1 histidine kinase [Rhizobium leguminosarum]